MKKLRILGVILIVFGIIIFFLGALFKILHWPGLYVLLISGPIIMILGFVLMLLKSKV